jgi:hypothetical protein
VPDVSTLPEPASTALAPPSPEPAAMSACGNYGYLLAGLAVQGNCPECGQPFDRHTLILFGTAGRSASNGYNAGPWALSISLLLSVLVLWPWIMTIHHGNAQSLLMIPLLLLAPIVSVLRRFNLRQPGPIRVRIDVIGCAQDDLTTLATPKRRAQDILLTIVVIACMITFVWSNLYWLAVGVGFGALVGLIILVVRRMTTHPREKKSALIYGPANVAGGGNCFTRSCRWRDVRTVTISPTRTGRWRIRAIPIARSLKTSCMDAVFDATADQLESLKEFAGQFGAVEVAPPQKGSAVAQEI